MTTEVERAEDWEIGIRKKVIEKRGKSYYFSINKRGEISMNDLAWSKLLRREKVVLLYDQQQERIGVKIGWEREKQLFNVRKHGRGRKSCVIRAGKLLRQFGITIDRTLVFDVSKPSVFHAVDTMFVLDMRKAKGYKS